MNDQNEELYRKLEKMSLDDLLSYQVIAKNLNHIAWAFGIGLFLLVIYFPNIFMVIACAILIGLAATVSVNLDNVSAFIQKRIGNKR